MRTEMICFDGGATALPADDAALRIDGDGRRTAELADAASDLFQTWFVDKSCNEFRRVVGAHVAFAVFAIHLVARRGRVVTNATTATGVPSDRDAALAHRAAEKLRKLTESGNGSEPVLARFGAGTGESIHIPTPAVR